MDGERVWILDTEGNGEHPGEIIELAAVEMIDFTLTGRYREWRFRPKQPIHPRATRIHGITNRDLRHCAPITDHIDEIRDVLGEHAIAGHAVHVELAALQRVLEGWVPVRAYDTLRMARRAFPDLERHRLTSVGDHLQLSGIASRLTGKGAHCALYDALLCGLILRHIAHPLDIDARHEMMRHAEIMEIRRKQEAENARKAAKALLRRKMSLDMRRKRIRPDQIKDGSGD